MEEDGRIWKGIREEDLTRTGRYGNSGIGSGEDWRLREGGKRGLKMEERIRR